MQTKKPLKPEEKSQSERFIETATALVDAGELNLTEAKAAFEEGFVRIINPQKGETPTFQRKI